MQHRRAGTTLRELAVELGVANTTLSSIERGTLRPSADTALVLARWLGWSMEQVMAAADEPVSGTDTADQSGYSARE